MNYFVYRISYWLRLTHWDSDSIPSEVYEAFKNGNIPEGPILDLGCGTGTCVTYFAIQGWQAIGIDFVPEAIAQARKKARKAGVSDRTQFLIADVIQLNKLNLPVCSFILDIGCFHGLTPDDQRKYAQGVADVINPNGLFMLFVLGPHKEAGISFGLTSEQVQAVFAPWFNIEKMQQGSSWGRKSTLFWMKRKK